MCSLVTVGLRDCQGDPIEIFRVNDLTAQAAVNPHVRMAFPRGAMLLDITDGGCSCSFYRSEIQEDAWSESALRARYARKGWSNAKITRAIEGKRAAHERRSEDSAQERFCRSIEALVLGGAQVTLISHDYRGLFSAEQVNIDGRTEVPLQTFIAQQGSFPEDVLVTVRMTPP